MKPKLILLILIITVIQLAIAQGDLPTEPLSATLSFGNLNLPRGETTGYNLSMEGDGYVSVLGVRSKALYFVLGNEPIFYRKTLEDAVQQFDVPVDPDANFRITVVTGDASEVVINRLPYQLAYGDNVDFALDVEFGGTMYALIFSREVSNGAIKLDNIAGKKLFLYNDVAGGMLLLKDNGTTQSVDVAAVHNLDFRPPGAPAAGEDESAEERRRERAGAVVEVVEGGEGCTDVDGDAGNEQYSMPSYGYDASGAFLSDFCASDPFTRRSFLNEVRCNAEGAVYLEEHRCDDDCSNGACREEAREETAFCYDTDFPGRGRGLENSAQVLARSYATKGVNAGFFAAGRDITYGFWTDYCNPDVANTLVEYSCILQKTRFTTVVCGSGCNGGECSAPPYCTDSDGGDNSNAKGTVNKIFSRGAGRSLEMETQTDACVSGKLKEYFCNNDASIGFKEESCTRGCFNGRCIKEGEVLPKPCTEKEDCNFSQGCVKDAGAATGVCGECSNDTDCGGSTRGWRCKSGRCSLNPPLCMTDINCKLGEFCRKGRGEVLGSCKKENITNLGDVALALVRRWERVQAYDRIIALSESLHGLALPSKKTNGQACLVNSQCRSNYCNPETSKCEVIGGVRAGAADAGGASAAVAKQVSVPARARPIVP